VLNEHISSRAQMYGEVVSLSGKACRYLYYGFCTAIVKQMKSGWRHEWCPHSTTIKHTHNRHSWGTVHLQSVLGTARRSEMNGQGKTAHDLVKADEVMTIGNDVNINLAH